MSIENKQDLDVFGGRPEFGRKPYEAGFFGGGGKPKFESTWKNLEDKNDRTRQEAEAQRRKLGEQAASIKDTKGKSVVDFAQSSLSSAFQNEGGEVFDNLEQRASQFETATRELFPEYKKAGNMHKDKGHEKDGVAARIFIEEAKFLRDQQNKVAGSKAPDRAVVWYPRPNKFYLDPDFVGSGLDDNPSDRFVFTTPASSPHTPPFTVSPDTVPTRVENFTDPGLVALYPQIGSMPQSVAERMAGRFTEELVDAKRAGRDTRELEAVISLLNQRAASATRPERVHSGGITVEDIARGVRSGYSGFAKEQKERSTAYEDFLSVEEWNKGLTPALGESLKTEYWEGLSQIERELLNIRRDLNSLASQKRNAGVVDFETYAKLPEVNSVQTKEVRMLCANLPGFEKALGEYARIFLQPSNPDSQLPSGVGVREIKSEAQATEFRRMVRSRLEEEVRNSRQYQDRRSVFAAKGMSDQEGVRLMAREAEQAAFNLLYGTNAFESWAQPWDESGKLDLRKYKPFINTRFTNPALMESLYPLTTAISKGRDGKVHGGKQYDWIAAQMARLKRENGGKVDYSAIQVVDTNNKGEAERTYWRVKNGTLMVPEVYLRKVVASPWERYKANGQRLVDSLQSGVKIDWDSLRAGDNYTDDFTGQYARDAKKAQTVSNALLSGLGSGKPGEATPEQNLQKAVEVFPLTKQQLLYIYTPIYPYDNIPYAEGVDIGKMALGGVLRLTSNFFETDKDGYFPWDGPKIVKTRSNRR